MLRFMLIMISINMAHTEYNVSHISPGFLFEPIADIELQSGHWKFLTNLNLTSFFEELDYVTEIVNKTQEQCRASQILAHHHGNNFCDGLTIQLTDDLEEIIEANKYFIHKRQKRGLMNIVGHGLKFLFGTMDASDAEEHEQKFRHIEARGSKMETNLLQQRTYIQSTIVKLNETDVVLNQHSSIIRELDNEVSVFKRYMKEEHFYNQANSMFIQLVNYASILINKIRRDQSKLFDIIFASKQGILHESLFNPADIISEMQHIHLSLMNQQFPFAIEHANLYNIVNMANFNAIQIKNTIIFEINVPLYKPNKFTLYNIIAVPRLDSPNIYSFTTPEFPQLAINAESSNYFPIDPLKLSTACKEMSNNRYLCNQPGQIYKTQSRMNCEMSIFTQSPRQCTETKRKISGETWIWMYQKNKFFYILPETISIKLKCESEQTLQLEGIGILSTDGCTIETPQMILIGFSNSSSVFEADINRMKHFHIPLTNTTNHDDIWISPAFPSIDSIKLLEKDDYKYDEEIPDEPEYFQISITSSIIVVAIAIALLYYFAIWLWINGAKAATRAASSTVENI